MAPGLLKIEIVRLIQSYHCPWVWRLASPTRRGILEVRMLATVCTVTEYYKVCCVLADRGLHVRGARVAANHSCHGSTLSHCLFVMSSSTLFIIIILLLKCVTRLVFDFVLWDSFIGTCCCDSPPCSLKVLPCFFWF